MAILPHYFSPVGPGAALAVAIDNGPPTIECCGLADVDRGVEITADTVFELASASKMFTATGIMLLVERGCLDLTASIREYLPQILDPEAGRQVTVRDLLWHTSGLTDYLELGMNAAADHVSNEYIFSQLPAWSRRARAGEAFSYSNTNYVLLARIIQAASGLDFAEFTHANLFAPFDLNNTYVFTGGTDSKCIALGYSNPGYGLPQTEPFDNVQLDTVGDGGVFSSLNDLIRWQQLFWGGELVSEQSVSLMKSPGALDTGECFDYGFGLQVEQCDGVQSWCGHGGSWTNSTTMVGRYEEEHTSVVVLSNEIAAPVERISQRALAMSKSFS
jgi:CubicO group peptidase (beta-lactamase class C family)